MNHFLVCMVFVFSLGQGSAALAQSAPASTSSSLIVKVEPIAPLKLDAGDGAPWWTYFVPVVGPIVSGLLAFVGVWLGLKIATNNTAKTAEAAQKNNDAAIWQKANETELRDIQAKLDGFYMPFQLLSDANHMLAQDIRVRQPKDYRMLVQLFDTEWRESLSPGDKKIVEIVCNNAEELRALIANKSGLVDDKILPYLSRASVHFRILNLAYKSELGADPVRFNEYVYPRQLDKVLALEIERLRRRVEQLREKPGGSPPSREGLVIPPDYVLPKWSDPDSRLLGVQSAA